MLQTRRARGGAEVPLPVARKRAIASAQAAGADAGVQDRDCAGAIRRQHGFSCSSLDKPIYIIIGLFLQDQNFTVACERISRSVLRRAPDVDVPTDAEPRCAEAWIARVYSE